METTEDGFTFRRKEVNAKKVNNPLDSEFQFNVVNKKKGLKKTKIDSIRKEKNKENEINVIGEERNARKEQRNNAEKRRKTIEMENDIDLSTNSKDDTFVNNNLNEKPKSKEIHKLTASNSVNDLIKECVNYLGDGSKYSKEIINYCNSNYFSDIDYRKEIESNVNKTDQARLEIEKWDSIYSEEIKDNEIIVPVIEEYFKTSGSSKTTTIVDENLFSNPNLVEETKLLNKERMKKLQSEFNEKSKMLFGLENKIKYFLDNSKEKSENLLKGIFGSIGEKTVDAMFLLKAMSKLGR